MTKQILKFSNENFIIDIRISHMCVHTRVSLSQATFIFIFIHSMHL